MTQPLHEKELRTLATCRICRQKIGTKPMPILWKITAERHGIDLKAIERQTGLTQMLGGSATLAQAMGPDEPMTVPLDSARLTCYANSNSCIGGRGPDCASSLAAKWTWRICRPRRPRVGSLGVEHGCGRKRT